MQCIFAFAQLSHCLVYLGAEKRNRSKRTTSKPKLKLTFCFLVVFALKAAAGWTSRSPQQGLVLRLLNVALLFITCVRLLTFLRLFLSIGFIVNMLLEVLPRLGGFLVILLILNLNFATAITVLGHPVDLKTAGKLNLVAEPLAFIIEVFKLSLGDLGEKFQSSDPLSNYLILAIWLLVVLFIYIIMLNFVIAVVGETYQHVKDFYKQCHFQYKAQLNNEMLQLPLSHKQ